MKLLSFLAVMVVWSAVLTGVEAEDPRIDDPEAQALVERLRKTPSTEFFRDRAIGRIQRNLMRGYRSPRRLALPEEVITVSTGAGSAQGIAQLRLEALPQFEKSIEPVPLNSKASHIRLRGKYLCRNEEASVCSRDFLREHAPSFGLTTDDKLVEQSVEGPTGPLQTTLVSYARYLKEARVHQSQVLVTINGSEIVAIDLLAWQMLEPSVYAALARPHLKEREMLKLLHYKLNDEGITSIVRKGGAWRNFPSGLGEMEKVVGIPSDADVPEPPLVAWVGRTPVGHYVFDAESGAFAGLWTRRY